MSPLEYAAMLKQVSLLLTYVPRAYLDLDSFFQRGFCSGNRKITSLHLMSPLGYAAMLKQVSLLLTCVSGHIRILILISKRFLFRQQKENQTSPHVTPRVC